MASGLMPFLFVTSGGDDQASTQECRALCLLVAEDTTTFCVVTKFLESTTFDDTMA